MSTASLERQLTAIAKLPQTAMVDAAKAVEKIAREVGSSIGPVHLGKRKRSVRLTAVTRIKGRGKEVQATVWGRPTGPWVWVTSGTRGHQIPKQRSRGRGRSTRYLKGDKYAHPYGKPVHHPGASGKGAWKRVVTRAKTEVPKVFQEKARAVMR